MPGKGAYVLTLSAIDKKRNTLEQAKLFKNYFAMCTTIVEMANALPNETVYRGTQFGPDYQNKPFRALLDNRIMKDFPQCVLEKDNLDIGDEKSVKKWYFVYGALIERVIADYVRDWHKRGRSGGI